jgi:hypothetical protein
MTGGISRRPGRRSSASATARPWHGARRCLSGFAVAGCARRTGDSVDAGFMAAGATSSPVVRERDGDRSPLSPMQRWDLRLAPHRARWVGAGERAEVVGVRRLTSRTAARKPNAVPGAGTSPRFRAFLSQSRTMKILDPKARPGTLRRGCLDLSRGGCPMSRSRSSPLSPSNGDALGFEELDTADPALLAEYMLRRAPRSRMRTDLVRHLRR